FEALMTVGSFTSDLLESPEDLSTGCKKLARKPRFLAGFDSFGSLAMSTSNEPLGSLPARIWARHRPMSNRGFDLNGSLFNPITSR
ncbi:MAG: hypothetical protein RLZZ594_580, partial [Actinomycetota bacterium]